MSYTAVSALAVVAAVSLDRWLLRTRLTGSRPWWLAYAIILLFQLVTNGWLTGREIVTYDDGAILGSERVALVGDGRLDLAPVEDVGFGFALVLATCVLWVRLRPERTGA